MPQLILFMAVIVLPSRVFAANDNDASATRPTRLYRACAQYLEVPTPPLFALSRGSKTALLIGTLNNQSAHLLPDHIKEAIGKACNVVDTQTYKSQLTEALLSEAMAAMENPVDTHVIEALGDLGAAYLRYMKMAGEEHENIITTPLGVATGVLIHLSGSLMADFSAQEYARARSMNLAIDQLDPEPTPDELVAFGEELNLLNGVSELAQFAGAQAHNILPPELAEENLKKMRSIDMVREMVKALLTIEKHQFKLADLQDHTLAELDESYDRMNKLLPKIALELITMNHHILDRLEQMFDEKPRLLINMELQFLVGSRGLIRSLERRGFTVERIESERDWQNIETKFLDPRTAP